MDMHELRKQLDVRLDGSPADGTQLSWNDLIGFLMRRWWDGRMLWLCSWLPLVDKRNLIWMFMILPPHVETEVANVFRNYSSVMDAGKKLDLQSQITKHYGELAIMMDKLSAILKKLAAAKK